ncbi:MAG: translation initiation factor 2 [Candidatus Methanofastidiosa archaeon]|nr:translation initiation factor 2 [Candidatus Methanofastidiosa archaeon]
MSCDHEEYVVLKERGRLVTAKCLDCEQIFTFKKEKDVKVPVIVNRRGSSEKSSVNLERDRMVVLDEILDLGDEEIEVHSIEVGNKRVKSEKASEITSIWGISLTYPKVVGASIHFPRKTASYKVIVDRETIYNVGDPIQVGATTFKVTTLITERGKRKAAYGDEIKRIYGTPSNISPLHVLEVYDGP